MQSIIYKHKGGRETRPPLYIIKFTNYNNFLLLKYATRKSFLNYFSCKYKIKKYIK